MPLQANRTLRHALTQKSGRKRLPESGSRGLVKEKPHKKKPKNTLESLEKELQKAELFGKILFFGTGAAFIAVVALWVALSLWCFSRLT